MMNNNTEAINTSFSYSTEPFAVVAFDIQPISKAIRYNFTISDGGSLALQSMEIEEVELDSSQFLKVGLRET